MAAPVREGHRDALGHRIGRQDTAGRPGPACVIERVDERRYGRLDSFGGKRLANHARRVGQDCFRGDAGRLRNGRAAPLRRHEALGAGPRVGIARVDKQVPRRSAGLLARTQAGLRQLNRRSAKSITREDRRHSGVRRYLYKHQIVAIGIAYARLDGRQAHAGNRGKGR